MPDTDVRTLAELDHLELGLDTAWDDLWWDGERLIVDTPGWWWWWWAA